MKPFLEKTFRQKGTDLGKGLSSRPIVGVQRQAGCHLPHIFHEYPQIYISVSKSACDMVQLWHVSTKLSLPLSFHCSSKLQATCYSLHRLKYPTLHATLSSWHQPPFTCTPHFFRPDIHLLPTAVSRFPVDGPMWWLSEDMHHVLGFITTIQPWPSKRLMCQVPTGGFIVLIDVVYRESQIFHKLCWFLCNITIW